MDPRGDSHRSGPPCFPYYKLLWTPRGDLIRNSYADRLLQMLFQCSQDLGSQMPAAICCDLNRNPDECAFLKVAMARFGWTDFGQQAHGENHAPPHVLAFWSCPCRNGGTWMLTHRSYSCKQSSTSSFQKLGPILRLGIVTMPKTPQSVIHLERFELPEAVDEEITISLYHAVPQTLS